MEVGLVQLVHELSVLSPRYRGLPNPNEALDQNDDPTKTRVGEVPLVMRSGPELTSEKICDVPPGTAVEVLEHQQGHDAQTRTLVRYVAKGWLSRVVREGWVTSVHADGTALLIEPSIDSFMDDEFYEA
uniref:Uncharacterized protein n=1 Tax=Haptolina brevifila TaxID=156173 RepID=A0A7S2BE38_9EUKA